MSKEEVLDIVGKAFIGHPAVISRSYTKNGVEVHSAMLSGQSFRMEDFSRLKTLMDGKGYTISFLIDSGILMVMFTKEV